MLGSILGIVLGTHLGVHLDSHSHGHHLSWKGYSITNLAQGVQTLADQSTSTHSKLSDISRSQYELSRSQTLIQSRLAKVEDALSVVVTGPSGNDFVSYAAPLDVAAPSTTHTSIEEPPFVTNSSSALATCSL